MSKTPGIAGASEEASENLSVQRTVWTETPPSMRKRLKSEAAKAYNDFEQQFGHHGDLWGVVVDAILAELPSMSDEAVNCVREKSAQETSFVPSPALLKTLIAEYVQHIRDGGR